MKIKLREKDRIADETFGKIVKCEALPWKLDEWPYFQGTCVPMETPFNALCDFKVSYENGYTAVVHARGLYLLCGYGFHSSDVRTKSGCRIKPSDLFGDKVEADNDTWERYCFFNRELVATVLQALLAFKFVPRGEVELVEAGDVQQIFKQAELPLDAVDPSMSDDYEKEVYLKWRGRWVESGDLVPMCEDGSGYILAEMKRQMLVEETMEAAKGLRVEMCDGTYKRVKEMTDEDWGVIADPAESAINARVAGGNWYNPETKKYEWRYDEASMARMH